MERCILERYGRGGAERRQRNKQGRMEEEANQFYRRTQQMTGQARDEGRRIRKKSKLAFPLTRLTFDCPICITAHISTWIHLLIWKCFIVFHSSLLLRHRHRPVTASTCWVSCVISLLNYPWLHHFTECYFNWRCHLKARKRTRSSTWRNQHMSHTTGRILRQHLRSRTCNS